jgi:hypothetical protein
VVDVLVAAKILKCTQLTKAHAQDRQQEQTGKKKHEAKLKVLDA